MLIRGLHQAQWPASLTFQREVKKMQLRISIICEVQNQQQLCSMEARGSMRCDPKGQADCELSKKNLLKKAVWTFMHCSGTTINGAPIRSQRTCLP